MPHFVGRAEEESALARVIAHTTRIGNRGSVVLAGEAGAGKTTLVSRATASAAAAGCRVVRIEADPFEPGAVADDLRASLGAGDRALIDAVEDATRTSPIIIVVDDAHWADDEAIRVVGMLHREAELLPVVFVIAARPLPRSPALAHLVAEMAGAGAVSLTLAPLADDEVLALARHELGREPSRALAEWLEQSGGNPLYVTELIDAARRTPDGEWPPRLPSTLADAVRHRVNVLGELGRDALAIAAVIGRRFKADDLAAVMRKPIVELAGVLTEAAAAGILSSTDDDLEFRHQLIHDVVYTDVPRSVRGALHREVAVVLAERYEPDRRLVEHVLRATLPSDPSTVDWLYHLADEMARRLPASSLLLLERALTIIPPADERHLEIAASVPGALLVTGRSADALEAADRLLQQELGPELRMSVLNTALAALQYRGDYDEIRRRAAPILADPNEAAECRVAAGSRLAFAELLAGDARRAASTAASAVAVAPAVTADAVLAVAHGVMAIGSLAEGDAVAAVAHSRRFVRPLSAHRDHLFLGVCLLEAEDSEAESVLGAGVRLGAERDPGDATILAAMLALHAVARADLDAAATHVEAAAALAAVHGEWLPEIHFIDAIRARIALHRGEVDLARAAVARAVAARDRTLTGILHDFTAWVDGLVTEVGGDDDGALGRMAAAWDAAGQRRFFLTWRHLGPDLVRLASLRGADDVARSVLRDVSAVDHQGRPGAEACVLRCRGLLERDVDALTTAAHLYDTSSRPMDAAMTRLEAASVLERRDHRRSELLREALRVFDAVGAAGDAARAARALGRTRSAPRPAEGWAALTPAQLAVVDGVAAGLSNPQIADMLFLSRHTVATHLKHIFRKLSITSRAELAANAARRAQIR